MDPGPTYIESLGPRFLVECRRCGGSAVVLMTESWPPRARATCGHCGHVQEQPEPKGRWTTDGHRTEYDPKCVHWGAPVDPCLHLPLWLRTPCCGHELWAYNGAHLAWLRDFVAAKLRPNPRVEGGHQNQQLASRLPRWMLDAKNRERVMESLAWLDGRLP